MVKLGSIIAWVLIFSGVSKAGLGLIGAYAVAAEDRAYFATRYLATANTGEAIDKGLVILVVGVVIGLLVEIAKKNTASEEN
jgi:hypothetical protein